MNSRKEIDVKAIVIIKAVSTAEYEIIRDDLTRQMMDRGWDLPVFATLPGDYPEIEVVWLDEKMEIEKHAEVVKQNKGRFRGVVPFDEIT